MKFKSITILCLLVLVLSAMYNAELQNIAVKKEYLLKLDDLQAKLLEFSNNFGNAELAKANYLEVRRVFKQVEFLLAEIDAQFYLQNINGAPLAKLEKNVPGINILSPKGLQVIDEIMGEYEAVDSVKLKHTVSLFEEAIKQAILYSQSVEFTDELLMHAIQHQLLRIYTLGITGFDTPGTLQGITDAGESISGILELSQMATINFGDKWVDMLKTHKDYFVQHDEFESFDRITYYKVHWQPLYAECISIVTKNNILNWNLFNNKQLEVNALEPQLFSENFFNLGGFLDFTLDDVNDKTIALGEKLFYDKRLSANGKMSCSSCHNPNLGFADGLTKSRANDGSLLQRNAPGLINSVYAKGFFYDLRAEHLSQQFEHVIFSKGEFNTSLIKIFEKLDSTDYPADFIEAFPMHTTRPVNPYTFKTALSAYLSTLNNFNSTFDKFMRSESEHFSKKAQKGYNLFMGKAACATCHFPPTFAGLVPPYFNDSETEVLGVPSTKKYEAIDPDLGRYSEKIPKDKVDFFRYSFKTTTVRNTKLTAPYMHNGVFSTYTELMEFYNNGGGVGHKLVMPNQTLASNSLGLSKHEINYIISFLKTL